MPEFKSATKPKATSSNRGKASSAKPLLSPAKRRELLDNRVQGVIELVNKRALTAKELRDEQSYAVDAGTAFILNMNKDDLVRVYCQAAEHNSTFARMLDQTLTGGIWGELIAVTLVTVVGVGLVRGWIDPTKLPAAIRAFLPTSMFGPPPPSDEVQAEEARAQAADNGAAEPKPEPQRRPVAAKPKPKPARKAPKKGKGAGS
jgi:hypothetical protein